MEQRSIRRRELHPRPMTSVSFEDSNRTMSVSEFEAYRSRQKYDTTGVYVLHNGLLDKWYVGQSKTMLSRIHGHFAGKGCRGVFMDYQSGHPFRVQMISLQESGYASLDVLEHDLIHYYQADEYGYNVLKGNQVRSAGHDNYYRADLLRRLVFPVRRKPSRVLGSVATASVIRKSVASVLTMSSQTVSAGNNKSLRLREMEHETDCRVGRGMPIEPVYIAASGSKYHFDANCRFVRNKRHLVGDGSEVYRVDRSLAEAAGYSACSVCRKK